MSERDSGLPFRQSQAYLPTTKIQEEISYAAIHALASICGFSCERRSGGNDLGSIDLEIKAHGKMRPGGKWSRPGIAVQLKSTTVVKWRGNDSFSYDVPIHTYNDLLQPSALPALLVLLAMPTDRKEWFTCGPEHLTTKNTLYWYDFAGLIPKFNKTKARIEIPRVNQLTPEVLHDMMMHAATTGRVR